MEKISAYTKYVELKWMFLPWKRDILWDSMIWQILFLSWQFVWVDELLFAVRAVSGFFINLPIFPQPPESPGILPTAGDHLLQEPTGGLQVQQGAQVQVRQEQADHRRGDDTGQQTHLAEIKWHIGRKLSSTYLNSLFCNHYTASTTGYQRSTLIG